MNANLKAWFRDPSFWIAAVVSLPGEALVASQVWDGMTGGAFDPASATALLSSVPLALWVNGHMSLRRASLKVSAPTIQQDQHNQQVAPRVESAGTRPAKAKAGKRKVVR